MTTTTAPPGIDPADWARMSWWQQERCMARLERESRARLNQLRQAHTRNVTAILRAQRAPSRDPNADADYVQAQIDEAREILAASGHDPDAAQHLADLEAAT